MKVGKNMVVVVGGSVVLVLLAIALGMLIKFRGTYGHVNADLRSAQERLEGLYRSDPYPSPGNVLLVQTNLGILQDYFAKLFTSLREGQIEPVKMEPAEFPQLRDKTIEGLRVRAAQSGTALPSRFAFGMDRYAVGALPNQQDLPRLVVQLRTIEELCRLMFDARVTELVSIKRPLFEQAAGADEASFGVPMGGRGRQRGIDMPTEPSLSEPQVTEWKDPSGLFTRERYTFTFRASDAAVWAVLDALARGKPFAVVSLVTLVNETPLPKATARTPEPAPAAQPGAGGFLGMRGLATGGGSLGGPGGALAAAAAPPERELSHEERIVAGREMVKAVIDVDVYRFESEENREKAE